MALLSFRCRNSADLERLSEEQKGLRVTSQLNEKELNSPASGWTYRHLIAYHLLTSPAKPYLTIFKTDHDNECPVCKPHKPCRQRLDGVLTDDPCPRNLFQCTESELMRLPNGAFWVALARATRPEPLGDERSHPQRERKPVVRNDQMDSSTVIPGSSSPTMPSSSEFEVSLNIDGIDEDEHEARRRKPEEVTVHLVICFLQLFLNLWLVQDPHGTTEVRPRIECRRSEIRTGAGSVLAEDDGGICTMVRKAGGWAMKHPFLALLEAKRAFKQIYFDEHTGEGKPIASNETLAQCLGEAVVTWRANPDYSQQDIFMIAATNSFLRFMHFRRNALCHILALLRWHDAHSTLELSEGQEDTDDSMEEDIE
ncbi:hypothetical protein QBC33DRAFT_614516 [Phialemonium atrogriseum]|uniref:Uncharacterized protein n=1 Tax=Phialemonium atrogriseum TaxID=1093897 RepID=A0AAJ0BPX4_9PEZI|nr:uncharacterized protein QBC33DRAFT_614516 [Phialemonium atrogriseum]KAK1762136.1 hypothetical protein QBC33DRAFT_614516 [Phialemonium atrogriseum]